MKTVTKTILAAALVAATLAGCSKSVPMAVVNAGTDTLTASAKHRDGAVLWKVDLTPGRAAFVRAYGLLDRDVKIAWTYKGRPGTAPQSSIEGYLPNYGREKGGDTALLVWRPKGGFFFGADLAD